MSSSSQLEGGEFQDLGYFQQGVICDSAATAWIYYRGGEFSLDSEEKAELDDLMSDAETEFAVDLSSSEGSDIIAKKFFCSINDFYGDVVIFSSNAEFFTIQEIDKAV